MSIKDNNERFRATVRRTNIKIQDSTQSATLLIFSTLWRPDCLSVPILTPTVLLFWDWTGCYRNPCLSSGNTSPSRLTEHPRNTHIRISVSIIHYAWFVYPGTKWQESASLMVYLFQGCGGWGESNKLYYLPLSVRGSAS